MSEQSLLQQAIAAARAGRKAEAWRLLAQVLHQNQRNELAWLWLSSVVDSEEQRVKCLENVLMISPNNTAARNGLAQLQACIDTAPATPRPATPPSTVRCPHCGTPNRIGSLFCKKCGQSLEQTKPSPTALPPVTPCPHCGAMNRAGATFCSGCGQGLGQAKPSPQAQTARCPGCGFGNLAGAQFCGKCGQRLNVKDPSSPAQTAPVPSTPPKATSPAPSAASPAPKPQREVDTSQTKKASIRSSPGPVPAALGTAGFFLLVTAGAWVISAIMAIGWGGLAAIISVWNLLVCGAIVHIAIQLFNGNAKSRSAAIGLFNINLLLMNGQILLFGEMMDETILIFDVIGLVALGIQAAILLLNKKQIERWWQAKQRFQRQNRNDRTA